MHVIKIIMKVAYALIFSEALRLCSRLRVLHKRFRPRQIINPFNVYLHNQENYMIYYKYRTIFIVYF